MVSRSEGEPRARKDPFPRDSKSYTSSPPRDNEIRSPPCLAFRIGPIFPIRLWAVGGRPCRSSAAYPAAGDHPRGSASARRLDATRLTTPVQNGTGALEASRTWRRWNR